MRYTPNFSHFDSLFDLVSYFNSEKKCERFTTMLNNAIGLCTYEQVKMVA